eukprot:COSAG02_NODE_6631_length_3449_cov_1.855821_3_plen_364_part_00
MPPPPPPPPPPPAAEHLGPPPSTSAPRPAGVGGPQLSLAEQLAQRQLAGGRTAALEALEAQKELQLVGAVEDAVPFDQQISVEAFQDLQLKANLEYWIEPLRDITFDTALAPISVADANLLIRCFEHYDGPGKDGASLPAADAEALVVLESTLSACMASLNAGEGARFFVKDSSRGPKDFGLTSEDFVAQYKAAMRAANATTDDEKLAVMLEVATAELSIGSASEALPLFVRSRRVNVDMRAWLNHHDKHPMNWVVRTWRAIDVDLEFRCFVFGGRINAISQYNHNCFFQRLVDRKDYLQALMARFFEEKCAKSCNALYPEGYIIDFAITGQALDQVLVIEINPGLSSTSGCLFDWVRDKKTI